MREIHVFMSPFSLIIYNHFFTVRITRSTTLTLETCTGELKLTKSSSCCLETVFPTFVLLFMHNTFFSTKTEGNRLEWDKYSYKRQPDSFPKPFLYLGFCYHAISNTFLVLWTCCQQGNLQNLQKYCFMGPW